MNGIRCNVISDIYIFHKNFFFRYEKIKKKLFPISIHVTYDSRSTADWSTWYAFSARRNLQLSLKPSTTANTTTTMMMKTINVRWRRKIKHNSNSGNNSIGQRKKREMLIFLLFLFVKRFLLLLSMLLVVAVERQWGEILKKRKLINKALREKIASERNLCGVLSI